MTYLDKGPVILNFAYFTCPRLCHLIVDGMVKGLNSLPNKDLENVQILSISFDRMPFHVILFNSHSVFDFILCYFILLVVLLYAG